MLEYNFTKLNDEPVNIEFTTYENGETVPSFYWADKRYYLSDFIRAHNNPWYTCGEDMPSFIHAVSTDFFNPIFLSIHDDETLDIYTEQDL